VDQRRRGHWAGRYFTIAWHTGARDRWRSPALAEEDKSDEAVPAGCSLEHEQRRRGGTIAAEDGGRSFTSRERQSEGRTSIARWGGVVVDGGGARLI
jgi:hypothetical protein